MKTEAQGPFTGFRSRSARRAECEIILPMPTPGEEQENAA